MEISGQIINPIKAQTDTDSHPTIPYVPPTNPTPTDEPSVTVTDTPSPQTGPYIYLSSEQNSYDVGENGAIFVNIDTNGEVIDEYQVVIEFDPSHIDVIDSDAVVSGIQINFIDTAFELVPGGNLVETDIVGTESGLPGRITLRAQTDVPASISDRIVAEIEFTVSEAKTSEMTIAANSSTLLSDSVNILETNLLEPFVINSTGTTLPTPTSVVVTQPPITPKTAISSPEGFLFAVGGVLLIVSGIILRKKSQKQRSIDDL